MSIHLISSLFCELPVYLNFSPISDVLSEDKVSSLPFVIFRLNFCVHTLSILLIYSRLIWYFLCPIFCVPSWSSIYLCLQSFLLPFFVFLPSVYRYYPPLSIWFSTSLFLLSTLQTSVYFLPVLVLTYTHHILTEYFLCIISYWDSYWRFIHWVISVHHRWQRTVLYLILYGVFYSFGV